MAEAAPVIFPLRGRRVYIAGHRGMVGSALMRRLAHSECEIRTVARSEVDLRRQSDAEAWMAEARPEVVFVAAATVGGILANDTRPADFIYDNLMIAGNLIEAARRCKVAKLLYLVSSCIYPREVPQPMAELALLNGPARADQSVVCRGENRRSQALRSLPPAIRLRFHFGTANQPLRAG